MKKKTGPKLENGIHRVRLLKCGPWIRKDVDDTLRLWQQVHGVPTGRAIDAMFDYVKDRADFRIPKKGLREPRVINQERTNDNETE